MLYNVDRRNNRKGQEEDLGSKKVGNAPSPFRSPVMVSNKGQITAEGTEVRVQNTKSHWRSPSSSGDACNGVRFSSFSVSTVLNGCSLEVGSVEVARRVD